LQVVAHRHTDLADVPPARAGGSLQAKVSDHLPLHARHQVVETLR
jgi:hypothetical protein